MEKYNSPDRETISMRYVRDEKVIYIVTKDKLTGIFTLYSVNNSNKLKKLKTADAPTEFDEIY